MPTPWDKSLPTGVRLRNVAILVGIGLLILCCLCGIVSPRTPAPAPTATPIPTATKTPGATAVPTVTPIPAPTATPRPTATPEPPSTPGVYYLWYKDQPGVKVAVMGPSHQSVPVDGNQLLNWVLNGTACLPPVGTKAYRSGVSSPWFTTAVEVAEGNCRGFIGWVPMEGAQPWPPQ